YDRLRCEALWTLQSHHAVDGALLADVLKAKTPQARAAAIHTVADEAEYLPKAFDLLAASVRDENPRVRLEAIRGLSFFPTLASAKAVLAAIEYPRDSWIDYTLEHTMAALEPAWKDEYESGKLAADNPKVKTYIETYISHRAPSYA